MKFLVITPVYPSEKVIWGGMFIHKRVKRYIQNGHEVCVFVTSRKESGSYVFEGVKVFVGDVKSLLHHYLEQRPERLLLHFVNRYTIEFLKRINYECPTITWIHGWEAINFVRNYFDYSFNLQTFKSLLINAHQNMIFPVFLRKANSLQHFTFVFVSNWMKEVTEKDNGVRIKRFHIIPNGIDTDFFAFTPKSVDERRKILTIRPFTSKKYATDLVVEVINKLSSKNFFSKLNFTICGDGVLFERVMGKLRSTNNVRVIRKMLTHEEIKQLHSESGVFLSPTRMDAQGVSMCEAMSSGLVPVASRNTGIPEFVDHNRTGFLCRNIPEMVEVIEYIYHNPEKFLEMSEQAAEFVRKNLDERITTERELEVIINTK